MSESAIAKVYQLELKKKQQPIIRGQEQMIKLISKTLNSFSRQVTKNVPDRRHEPETCLKCGD